MPTWLVIAWIGSALVGGLLLWILDYGAGDLADLDRTRRMRGLLGRALATFVLLGVVGGVVFLVGDIVFTGGENLPSGDADQPDPCDARTPPPEGC